MNSNDSVILKEEVLFSTHCYMIFVSFQDSTSYNFFSSKLGPTDIHSEYDGSATNYFLLQLQSCSFSSLTSPMKMSSSKTDSIDLLEELMLLEFFSPYQYQYRPLLSPSAIRLFRLEAGVGETKLRGSLIHTELDQSARYEALSYAWGSPEKTKTVYLDQTFMPITESLFTALKRLRNPHQARVLWIDAIAINQQDNQEKSKQIMLMHKIYSSAVIVLCWLGEDSDIDPGGIGLALSKKIDKTDFSSLEKALVTTSFLQARGFPPKLDAQWTALERFWKSPWFQRSWIVQEFSAGKKVQMLLGQHKVDWLDLAYCAEKIGRYNLLEFPQAMDESIFDNLSGYRSFARMAKDKGATSPDLMSSFLLRFYSELDQTCLQELTHYEFIRPAVLLNRSQRNMSDIERKYNNDLTLSIIKQYQPILEAPKRSLIHYAVHYHPNEASDPRDKLFAFLALSFEAEIPALRPDYSESTETVYTRFARYFLVESGPKIANACLSISGVGYPSSSSLRLPSWVPDWSNPSMNKSHLPSFNSETFIGRAAGDTEPHIRFDDLNRLYIRGGFLGLVDHRLEPPKFSEFFSSLSPQLADWQSVGLNYLLKLLPSYVDYFTQLDNLTLVHPYQQTQAQVQWRTLIGDNVNSGLAPDTSFGESYDKFRALTKAYSESTQDDPLREFSDLLGLFNVVTSNLWFRQWSHLCGKNVVCQLDNGFLGLLPIGTKVGDCVYLPLGWYKPLVLQSSETEKNSFVLLGPSYVHGMMKGEALNMKTWETEEICIL
jgi:Heterokaryon incompatibility protein (HET)